MGNAIENLEVKLTRVKVKGYLAKRGKKIVPNIGYVAQRDSAGNPIPGGGGNSQANSRVGKPPGAGDFTPNKLAGAKKTLKSVRDLNVSNKNDFGAVADKLDAMKSPSVDDAHETFRAFAKKNPEWKVSRTTSVVQISNGKTQMQYNSVSGTYRVDSGDKHTRHKTFADAMAAAQGKPAPPKKTDSGSIGGTDSSQRRLGIDPNKKAPEKSPQAKQLDALEKELGSGGDRGGTPGTSGYGSVTAKSDKGKGVVKITFRNQSWWVESAQGPDAPFHGQGKWGPDEFDKAKKRFLSLKKGTVGSKLFGLSR